MRIESIETLSVEEHRRYTLREVAECSGLTEADLQALSEAGVLQDDGAIEFQAIYSGSSLRIAQTARRLRDDFEIDGHAVVLAVQLVRRIRELEAELSVATAKLPRVLR